MMRTDKVFVENSFTKKNKISEDELILKEKQLIIYNYYRFVNNPTIVEFIEKCFNILNYDETLNTQFKISKEEEILTLVIVLVKSFLDEKSIVETSDVFINSDSVLNYCEDQYKKHLIIKKKITDDKTIRATFFCAINILIESGLIGEITTIVSNNNYKTIKSYTIQDLNYVRNEEEYFNFSYQEFDIIEFNNSIYITTQHYSKTFEVYKKNFYSNKSFKIKNKAYLIRKINLKLYVDNFFQKELLKEISVQDISDIPRIIKDKSEKLLEFYIKER
jgi:hypothetical protein